MKNLFLTIILSLFLCEIAFAQQPTPDFQTVKTEKGMMILNNNKTQPFSFLAAGGNPKGEQNDDGSLFIQTDRNGVLVYFVKTEWFADKTKKLNENEIPAAHRKYEVANFEQSVGQKINVDKEGTETFKVHDLRKGKDEFTELQTVYWSYLATDPNIPNRLYFQNVVIGDQILMLGMVFNKSTDIEKIRGLLKEMFESITLLPAPSIKKVAPVKKTPIKQKRKKAKS